MYFQKDIPPLITKLLDKKNNKFTFPLLIGLLGLILIIASNLIFSNESKEINNYNNQQTFSSNDEYKTELEESIKDGLSNVKGVGNVKVVITLNGENSKEIAYNETTTKSSSQNSQQSTTTKDAILIKDGSTSTPYTVDGRYPEVVGIMVVAQGAEDPKIEYYITESVKTLLNLPANKIIVLPMSE